MKKNAEKNCLILGGSYFIGKAFLAMLKGHSSFNLYVANRGTREVQLDSAIHYLKMDRNEVESCQILANYHFDIVIDFSCWSFAMLENIAVYLNNPYYIFISSGYAELTDLNHPDYYYGNQKKLCEEYIQRHFTQSLIVRPGYVMGANDYTERFHKHPDIDLYFYKNTTEIAMPYIDVNVLGSSIFNLIKHEERGLVRMGYV